MITGKCPFCSENTILVGDGHIHSIDRLYVQSWCKCGFSTPWRLSRAEVLDDMHRIMSAVALKEDKRVRSGKQKARNAAGSTD